MATPRTMISISPATKARLDQMRAGLVADPAEHVQQLLDVNPETINPAASGISYDALVCLLLEQRRAHAIRRARAQRAARARKKAAKRPAKAPLPE